MLPVSSTETRTPSTKKGSFAIQASTTPTCLFLIHKDLLNERWIMNRDLWQNTISLTTGKIHQHPNPLIMREQGYDRGRLAELAATREAQQNDDQRKTET
jgi:hypothetical protein